MDETPYKINPEWERLGPQVDIHFPALESYRAEFERVADEIARQYHHQVNEWTREQFVALIGQVVASGDFRLLVAPDSRFGAVYEPWAESQRLRSRVRELEEALESYRNHIDPELE